MLNPDGVIAGNYRTSFSGFLKIKNYFMKKIRKGFKSLIQNKK